MLKPQSGPLITQSKMDMHRDILLLHASCYGVEAWNLVWAAQPTYNTMLASLLPLYILTNFVGLDLVGSIKKGNDWYISMSYKMVSFAHAWAEFE